MLLDYYYYLTLLSNTLIFLILTMETFNYNNDIITPFLWAVMVLSIIVVLQRVKSKFSEFFRDHKHDSEIASDTTLLAPQTPIMTSTVISTFMVASSGCVPQSSFDQVSSRFLLAFTVILDARSVTEVYKKLGIPIERPREYIPEGGIETFRSYMKSVEKFDDPVIKQRFIQFVSVAMAFGLAPQEWDHVAICGYKLFEKESILKLQTFSDFAWALKETFEFFVESAYASWNEGSLMPFLRLDKTSTYLDEVYVAASTQHQNFVLGNDEAFSLPEFLKLLHDAKESYSLAVQTPSKSKDGIKIVIVQRLKELQAWEMEAISANLKTGTSIQAPIIMFEGPPGVSKTMWQNLAMRMMFAKNGMKYDRARISKNSPKDQYDSDETNLTRFILANDVGNLPPAQDPSGGVGRLLEKADNQRYLSVKAEVEAKGKIAPDILGIAGSTNVYHLHANVVSSCPASIYRRVTIIRTTLASQNYVGTDGAFDKSLVPPDIPVLSFNGFEFQDTHRFTFIRNDPAAGLVPESGFENLNGQQMLCALSDKLDAWYARQRQYTDVLQNSHFAVCDKCYRFPADCVCPSEPEDAKDDEDDQTSKIEEEEVSSSEEELEDEIEELPPGITEEMLDDFYESRDYDSYIPEGFPTLTKTVYQKMSSFFLVSSRSMTENILDVSSANVLYLWSQTPFFQWWYWIPDEWWDSDFIRAITRVLPNQKTGWMFRTAQVVGTLAPLTLAGYPRYNKKILPLTIFMFVLSYMLFAKSVRTAYTELSASRNGISDTAKKTREKYGKIITLVSSIVLIASLIWNVKKMFVEEEQEAQKDVFDAPKAMTEGSAEVNAIMNLRGPSVTAEGTLSEDLESLVERSARRNPWQNTPAAARDFGNGQTPTQAVNLVYGNAVILSKKASPGRTMIGLMIRTGVMLVPGHYTRHLIGEQVNIERGQGRNGEIFKRYICKTDVFPLVGRDLALIYLPGSPDFVDLSHLVPTTIQSGNIGIRCEWKAPGGKRILCPNGDEIRGTASYRARDDEYTGYEIEYNRTHRHGMCGAVAITDTRTPLILGIHIAGVDGKPNLGVVSPLFMSDIYDFINLQSVSPGKIFTAVPSAYELVPDILKYGAEAHPHSPHLHLTTEGFEYLGQRNTRAFYASKITPTPFAEEVHENFPSLPRHGKPRFGKSMWGRSAQQSFTPCQGFPSDLVGKACEDYVDINLPPFFRKICPLTDDEITDGWQGIAFAESMDFSTSAGLGYNGGKKAHADQVQTPSGLRWRFKPYIWEAFHKAEAQLKSGKRINSIFNTVPKDEATKESKVKVRLFQVSGIVLTMLIRKYYLPLNCYKCYFPTLFESAIGINATSREWEVVMDYALKFPNKIGGDFSSYDLRMAKQINEASVWCDCNFASRLGYSENDVHMMRMVASEFLNIMINMNGDVYLLNGSTPSGIPITVQINDTGNSLLLRICYYSIYTNWKDKFREYVALLTYGDDNLGSVSHWRRKFCFRAIQAILAKYDMAFTTPDKSEGSPYFLQLSQLDFLKRKSGKPTATFPYKVGVLAETSILKSMVCYSPSPAVSDKTVWANCVESALREYLFYGKTIYEERQKFLLDIAKRYDFAHMMSHAHKSFDERLALHIKDYP